MDVRWWRTAGGDLLGVRVNGIDRWRSIPYAQPPFGELRFSAPRCAQPWTGVRDAAVRPPAAIQPPLLPDLRTSEDCLYLNVSAPVGRSAPLPVIVWLHGGGFRIGAGDDGIRDGRALVSDGVVGEGVVGEGVVGEGVVVVSVNFRLGAFGFLSLGTQAPDAVNNGVLDQLAALEWVRDNVEQFGGDAARITVLGMSAGAKSVGTLLAIPRATAVLRRAVSMSGGADFVNTASEAAELAERFAHALPTGSLDVAQLRALPAAELLQAQESLTAGVAGTWTWRPTVDGRVLDDQPLAAIAGGSARGVDLIAGTVANEARLFTDRYPTSLEQAPAVAERVFGARRATVLAQYATDAGDDRLAGEAFMTDERYRVPTLRLVEAQQAHAEVRLYRFDGPHIGGQVASHGADATALWTGAIEGSALCGAWRSFAATGVPEHDTLPPWPTYDPTERLTMLFDRPPRVAVDPDRSVRARWDGVRWQPGSWAG